MITGRRGGMLKETREEVVPMTEGGRRWLRTWCWVALVVAGLCLAGILRGSLGRDRFDYPPCLRLGEELFSPDGAKEFLPAGAVYYGRIQNCVDASELPKEDLQANRPWDGRAVYELQPRTYCAYVDERWRIFTQEEG